MRELVNEAVCRVVGGWGRALLVRCLGSLRVRSWGLVGVGWRVWVVHKVSLLGTIACRVLLLLLLWLLGRLSVGWLSALALRLEDRVGKGRGGRRVGAGVGDELVVAVSEIEVQTVGVIAIHDGCWCRCSRQAGSGGVGLRGCEVVIVRLKVVESVRRGESASPGQNIIDAPRHTILNIAHTSVSW